MQRSQNEINYQSKSANHGPRATVPISTVFLLWTKIIRQ